MKKSIFLLRSGQSVLIWVLTNMIGSAGLVLINSQGFIYEEIVLISLIFSAPVLLFLVPVLYLLQDIDDKVKRIVFSGIAVLVICALVIVLFFGILPIPGGERYNLLISLLPYFLSAQISFFAVMHKLVLHGHQSRILVVNKSISSHEG